MQATEWLDDNTEHEQVEEKKSRNSKMSVADLLRKAGAIAVLASFATFLMKGWAGSNDSMKYLMLLSSTVGISAIAMVIANYLKESEGPRLLLSLALVAVPVNFAVLGAFLFYATAQHTGHDYPGYVAWTIESLPMAVTYIAAGIALLIPIAFLGFRTLARDLSVNLTALFALSNILLLLPVRESSIVAGIALVLGAATMWITTKTSADEITAKTKEGRLAILVQFVPIGILIGRTLWLYATEAVAILVAALLTFVLLRQIASLCKDIPWLRSIINFLSLVPVMISGAFFTDLLHSFGSNDALHVFFGMTLVAAMTYEVSIREVTYRNLLRRSILWLYTLGTALVLFLDGGVLVTMATIGMAMTIGFFAYQREERALTLTAVVLGLTSTFDLGMQAFYYFNMGSWIAMLLSGVAAICVASAIDSHGDRLKLRIKEHQNAFDEWAF